MTIELTNEELEWLENVVMGMEIEYDSIILENINSIPIEKIKKDHSIARSILSKLHKEE